MNWFGKKKTQPTTVSATSTQRPADPQTTIVKLRESIANQEKRWVCRRKIFKFARTFYYAGYCVGWLCQEFRPFGTSVAVVSNDPRLLTLTLCLFVVSVYREEHIQRKIEATVKEAKAKMAKGDKKGEYL